MTGQANLGRVTMSRFQNEERIVQLLQHLGLDQAHFAARLDIDWTELLAHYPGLVTSLTLIYPWGMDAELLRPLASQLLVVDNMYSPGSEEVEVIAQLPGVTHTTLSG